MVWSIIVCLHCLSVQLQIFGGSITVKVTATAHQLLQLCGTFVSKPLLIYPSSSYGAVFVAP